MLRRFGVRVIVGNVRATVRLGDIEIYQQRGHWLGPHAGAAIGVQCEATGSDVLFGNGVGDQLLGQLSGLAMGDHPADDVAAEDIEDYVQMKAGPLPRPAQLGVE